MRGFCAALLGSVLFGCSMFSSVPTSPAAVTCDELEAHVLEIGCDQHPVCGQAVKLAFEAAVQRAGAAVVLHDGCDAVLPWVPADCIMSATTPVEMIGCVPLS